ncbi:MAG TPA: hypothetical protein VG433_03430, partial [Pirellulales bacterium]|nr:hypothetical protein [Pirellulales bacterium]
MDEPSEQLLSLLERLRLATVGQVRSHRAQVRRLVGDLASFDSAWVDALAQNGLLTPFQAREINAGRSAGLQVGPFVLQRPQGTLGYCDCYTARHIESAAVVRLYVTAKLHVARDVA